MEMHENWKTVFQIKNRQVVGVGEGSNQLLRLTRVSPGGDCWPVSYTHLDVYKRQESFTLAMMNPNVIL